MKVTLLGSGNVAFHLGRALKEAGHSIMQVWSRNPEHAKALANVLGCTHARQIAELDAWSDVYIIAVSDSAIAEVSAKFPHPNKVLIHTSGTSPLDIPGLSGVLYPLQTFSTQRKVSFSEIPVAIEGEDKSVTELLMTLAGSISRKVFQLNSDQRKALHLAAVFACNFSNHLYALAQQILQNQQLDFELIKPLIAETAAKVQQFPPAEMQTGPAVRNDELTMSRHAELLASSPHLLSLYQELSQSIINFNQKA